MSYNRSATIATQQSGGHHIFFGCSKVQVYLQLTAFLSKKDRLLFCFRRCLQHAPGKVTRTACSVSSTAIVCFILTQLTTIQDPSIKTMAEQVAQDPAFAQMSAALQASMAGGAEAGLGASGGATPPIDPDQYAQAMSSVLQNPQFMDMAEKLGQQIMQVGAPSYFSGRAHTL